MIPAKRGRRNPALRDRDKYRQRSRVEPIFNKLKNWRRVATRGADWTLQRYWVSARPVSPAAVELHHHLGHDHLEEPGNARLTEWMEANLDVTRIRVRVDKALSAKEQRNFLEAEERKLIAETLPPLNLRDWPEGHINPLKAKIESARSNFTDQIRDTHRALRVARTRNAMSDSE